LFYRGDSLQEFGRGVSLSLYKDDVFGIYNTVQGAAIHGQSEELEGTIFGGRINGLNAPVALNPLANPVDKRLIGFLGSKKVMRRNLPLGVYFPSAQ
jgi:hypothetical protein